MPDMLGLFGYTKMGHMMTTLNVARVYLRVSTEDQDLKRQEAIIGNARASGYYVAAVYREKASGARSDRPELLRMIEDLQPGEVVIAEKIDRISRLPLVEAEKLVDAIRLRAHAWRFPASSIYRNWPRHPVASPRCCCKAYKTCCCVWHCKLRVTTSRTGESDSGKASTWPRALVYIEDASRMLKCMNRSLPLKAAGVALQRLRGWRVSVSAR
ncbi:hypothetical protein ALO80_200003 [Pseudomonas caricapapayae]|uniref:Uncharacterized protein n=1 Tax=Pseudomonas caricapapayae TaxID=46678 RepID=A0A0P9MTH5_9PSED|nr:hypothetical protein ALO80_200003 [Pseudomonas caricapapayae]RMM10100.1 hypothetical protein ALQ84_200148 [Pseudomonas caricapapayae]